MKYKPLYAVEYGPNIYHMAFLDGPFNLLRDAREAAKSVTYAGEPAKCKRIVRIAESVTVLSC